MDKRPLILILEDEEDILELEEFHLQRAGFDTIGLLTPTLVRQALEEEDVALMVIDRNLPGIEGSRLVAQLRQEGFNIPVIFVSAKDQDEDVEEGFRSGGDDYLRKPFNMNELLWRIKALLRRHQRFEGRILHYRFIHLNLDTRQAKLHETELTLSPLEFDLLRYFLEHRHRVISREELLEKVWASSDTKQSKKSVNVAVNRLKKKIERDQFPPLIEAVRGVGYCLC